MITVFADNKDIPVNMHQHSDGAITFKLDKLPENPRYVSVNVCPTTPVYRIMEELNMLVGCMAELPLNMGRTDYYLHLPYLPYARADRVFEKGNPCGLKMFLMSLNELGWFDEYHICDIHNKAAVESICQKWDLNLNIIESSQVDCFRQALPRDFNTKYDVVLAADKGAVDKAKTIATNLGVDVFNCGKERDITTGKVIKSTLPDIDFTGKVVLIPDDLLDGGYTFIKLAEQLKSAGAKQVDLYVTHLIASKGLDVLKGLIDNVYCYHTVGRFVNKLDVTNFNLDK